MPGHVKKGGKQEADPDPSPWLIVSNEMRNNRSIIAIIIITLGPLPPTYLGLQLTFLRK